MSTVIIHRTPEQVSDDEINRALEVLEFKKQILKRQIRNHNVTERLIRMAQFNLSEAGRRSNQDLLNNMVNDALVYSVE